MQNGRINLQSYLVVPGIRVEEREMLAASGGIDDLVDSGKRKVILRAVLI
jgi:hypothetical protein